MKLRRERIEFLANLIIETLVKEEMIIAESVSEAKLKTVQIIMDDFMIEDKLDDEVRAILNEHSEEMERQRIPYHEMFKAVKEKLVKDRNLIL